MSGSVARVGEVLRLDTKRAWLIVMVGLFGVTALAVEATRLGTLSLVLGFVVLGFAALVSVRWPLLSLVAFVALIPLEEVVVIDGFGTLSKLAGIMFALTYGVPRFWRLSFGAIPPAAWAYLVWTVLSLGWAISPDTAWGQLTTLLQLFMIAVLVADVVVQRPAMVHSLLWVYSLSATATAVLGVLSFLELGGVVGARAAAIGNQDEAQFAAVLLPALVFGLYEVLNGDRRILGAAVAVLTTAGVAVSGTRGAWLGVAVVVLLLVLPRLPLRRQVPAIAMIVLIGVATLQIPGVSSLIVERAGIAVSSGGAGRADIWTVGATIYRSAPLLGVGYANFPVAYTQDAVRASDVNTTYQGAGPHSILIGTLVELGPIGLLLLALFLLPLVLRRGWGPDAATVQAALASLLVAALFLDIVADRKQVWFIIGLAEGLAFVQRQRRTRQPYGELQSQNTDEGRPVDQPPGQVVLGAESVPIRSG